MPIKPGTTHNELVMYKILHASEEDLQNIINFIYSKWSKKHVLARNKSFFKYEFQEKNKINFILAKDKLNKIIGCIGYIKSNSLDNPDIWTSMWIVSKESLDPILGIRLFKYVRENIKHRYLLAPGADIKTLPIYKRLGIETGVLNQHYILNPSLSKFNIARVNKSKLKNFDEKNNINNIKTILRVSKIEYIINNFDFNCKTIPFKDSKYLRKKYFSHPYFSYKVYCVKYRKKISSIFVTRKINYNNSNALLIVDFLGNQNDLVQIGNYFYSNLNNYSCEYITFLEHGISNTLMKKTKFKLINSVKDKTIIPIYFSPFISKNITIRYFADNIEKNYWIFKADVDQDRPNEL